MLELPGFEAAAPIGHAGQSPPAVSGDLLKPMFGMPGAAVQAVAPGADQCGRLMNPGALAFPMVYGGSFAPFHGNELFEKIIVTPRKVELGYVLDDMKWSTSVWSTFGNTIALLESIDIDNNSELYVDNPYGLPSAFAPGSVRVYEMFASKDGPTTIYALIVFVFPGVLGADQRVAGTRISDFAIDVDWSIPVSETMEYLTDVLTSYTAREQRIALRRNPRTRISFLFSPVDKRASSMLEAMIYARQAGKFNVPFWPDAQKITWVVNPGDTTVFFDTALRKFRPGGLLILWRGLLCYKVYNIDKVNADHVTLTAPVADGWQADGGTYAIPGVPARWDGVAEFNRLTSWNNSIMAEFQCDPQSDVSPAPQVKAYGFDVLGIQPNMTDKRVMRYERTIRQVDSKIGGVKTFDRSGVAVSKTKGFRWTMHGREEIAAFRAFFAARLGRCVPFWAPTWQHDLLLDAPISATDTEIVIRDSGYVKYQYNQPARRYLCFIRLDGSGQKHYRKVVGVTEGVKTETLNIDSALGVGIAPNMCMVSFLHLVRLVDDKVELTWFTREAAEANIEFIELPGEVVP